MATDRARPALATLEAMALQQGGYFDRQDAQTHGIDDRLLHYHVKTGRFERCFPGVFRISRAPIAPHDDLLLAYVWTNYRGAVSHESALALYGLADVMPTQVHLTVPLDFRRATSSFVLHRSTLEPDDFTEYDGVCVTTPARSIVDAASSGMGPEQVMLAVRQGLDRALFEEGWLRTIASRSRYRNRRTTLPLIEDALHRATT
jgi:predicted transcriptional regulator of viral defense system